MKKWSPKTLLSKIASEELFKRFLLGSPSGKAPKHWKPGEVIKRLSSDERETLSKLKSEDIASDKLTIQP